MASKVTYSCDRCGKQVEENHLFTVAIRHANGSAIIGLAGEYNPDICKECVGNILKIVTEEWPEMERYNGE